VEFTGINVDGKKTKALVEIPPNSKATFSENGWITVVVVICILGMVLSFTVLKWVADSVEGSVVDGKVRSTPKEKEYTCPENGGENEDACVGTCPGNKDCSPSYIEAPRSQSEGWLLRLLDPDADVFDKCVCN
jgi:hypothetical protein